MINLKLENTPHCVAIVSKDEIDKEIWIQGRVHAIDEIQQISCDPQWQCKVCDTVFSQKVFSCLNPECKATGTVRELLNKETLQDQRYVELILEDNEGKTPDNFTDEHKLWLSLKDYDAWATLALSQRIRAKGMITVSESGVKQPVKSAKAYFLYMQVAVLEILEQREELQLTEQDRKEITEWAAAKGGNLIDELVKLFAPHIFGQSIVKESILYQIIGAGYYGNTQRSDIHVLIIGDASEGKTELATFACTISGGLYSSGEGISKVGLAAGLVKNEKTGRYVVEAGLAVLGNHKLKCLDEIDKMDKEYLKQLYTVMDKGFYKLDKIKHAEYETKGAWLVTGNPKYGKYELGKNITENIAFPPPLLSRFDLIFVLRRTYQREKTTQRLQAINAQYQSPDMDGINTTFLKKYLLLANNSTIKIDFEPSVFNRLMVYYHQIEANGDEDSIPITERQYHGLVRLAIARCKLCLRTRVTDDDAERAIELMQEMTRIATTDISTGGRDTNTLRGINKAEQTKERVMLTIMQQIGITKAMSTETSAEIIIKDMVKTGQWASDTEALQYLIVSRAKHIINSDRDGYYYIA